MNTNDDWLTPFVQQRVASIIATINDLTAWYKQCPCGATYTAHPNPDPVIHTTWLDTHEPHMNAPYYEEEP